MNPLIINQALVYTKDEKVRQQNYYSEDAGVVGTLKLIIEKMEEKLCVNSQDGKCPYWWKHDDCLFIMEFLYEISHDRKYLHFQKDTIDFEN